MAKRLAKFVLNLLIIVVLCGGALMALQFSQVREYLFGNNDIEILRIDEELAALRKDVNKTAADNAMLVGLSERVDILREKYAVLEENNLNTVRSKADVALVVGIIGRLDNIENKVSEVAKVSDKGALTALAVSLVKESLERGGDFTYETTVLEQLIKDEAKMKPYVEILRKYSGGPVYNETFLANEFEKIYSLSVAEDGEEMTGDNDWRVKFNKRFGKIMTISYKKPAEVQDIEKINLDRALYFIKSDEFAQAVEELNREKYVELVSKSLELKEWLSYANARVELTNALTKISAYALAIMKVNELAK